MRPSILCIDDDESSLKIRKLLLEVSGYDVFTAVSGADGIEALATGLSVDLVLLDYLMPGLNGDEVAKQLKQTHPLLPIIMFSAFPELPDEALQSVDFFLQKGDDPVILLDRLAEMVKRKTS
ncbi:MAG TPA: response regulator [Terriglobales bacterium]|nr:response regulator [Terriglobales bacterium]